MNNNTLEILEWDSEHFGFRIARTRRSDFTSVKRREPYFKELQRLAPHCIYHFADPDNIVAINQLHELGFEFAGTRLELFSEGKDISNILERSHAALIRPALMSDLARLEEIAGNSHRDTRFFSDKRFPKAKSIELYKIWINKAFSTPDTTILVADIKGQAVGYGTLTAEKPGVRRIGLFAVDSSRRGLGIGGYLLDSLLRHAVQDHACHKIVVAAQGTAYPAIRLYESKGFKITGFGVWFHRWEGQHAIL